jgi:hypothetical protein
LIPARDSDRIRHMRTVPPRWRLAWLAALPLALLSIHPFWPSAQTRTPATFAAQVNALSEPGGHFDTDNLISNERSYLEVVPELQERVQGGAYIGVGPDQNFSYIAAVRPSVAFILDIRRDNLLLHLLFKALFTLSHTRVAYLAQLTGRPLPEDPSSWRAAEIDRLVSYIDGRPSDAGAIAALRTRVDAEIRRTGVLLSPQDLSTIDRFHREFITAGLDLRFRSAGRPAHWRYPSYRELLREVDSGGRHGSYLSTEEAFQFVRSLQVDDKVIPVVGDLSGPTALRAIGRALRDRREHLSAMYVSNVEFYLFRQGRFRSWVDNLSQVPHGNRAVVIRSVFYRYLPSSRPDSVSTSVVQPVSALLDGHSAGRFRYYDDLFDNR